MLASSSGIFKRVVCDLGPQCPAKLSSLVGEEDVVLSVSNKYRRFDLVSQPRQVVELRLDEELERTLGVERPQSLLQRPTRCCWGRVASKAFFDDIVKGRSVPSVVELLHSIWKIPQSHLTKVVDAIDS